MADSTRGDLAAVLAPFEGQKGATIDALKAVQESEGYLSEESISTIAATLGVSRNTVYGVASYYEFFLLEPPARKVIRYCLGTVCDALGGRRVLDEITEILGITVFESTPDGEWAIERLPCFGTCARAPMMQINDEAYNELTVERVRTILTELPAGQSAPVAGDGRPAYGLQESRA